MYLTPEASSWKYWVAMTMDMKGKFGLDLWWAAIGVRMWCGDFMRIEVIIAKYRLEWRLFKYWELVIQYNSHLHVHVSSPKSQDRLVGGGRYYGTRVCGPYHGVCLGFYHPSESVVVSTDEDWWMGWELFICWQGGVVFLCVLLLCFCFTLSSLCGWACWDGLLCCFLTQPYSGKTKQPAWNLGNLFLICQYL